MVAALLETAFIDDANDAKKLASEKGQQAFAVGIAKGICMYFDKTYKE
jgi:N-acetylmuramoyl-L-alanine amidase